MLQASSCWLYPTEGWYVEAVTVGLKLSLSVLCVDCMIVKIVLVCYSLDEKLTSSVWQCRMLKYWLLFLL